MDGMARQFWLTVVPLLVGFSAVGLLVLAALFPDQLYEVGSTTYIATAAVALVSLGVLVWQLAVGGGSSADRYERL
ncbi:hypothetical protein [Haloarcula nitratireducens]|uniref:Cox cluster protein n=1 Tax=Haloarcula nitratireducens TaxID=2487749 RepID=A0AAW4PDB0_9EURY|nr:hypothetical protein [Halomicroarcula nitratireducens]MBX0295906.1 hypothetical protein [Halomicroarcula nitratireducens]